MKKTKYEEKSNELFLGVLGNASKSIFFKEKDFKKDLAPINARVENLVINGENIVRMTYDL